MMTDPLSEAHATIAELRAELAQARDGALQEALTAAASVTARLSIAAHEAGWPSEIADRSYGAFEVTKAIAALRDAPREHEDGQ